MRSHVFILKIYFFKKLLKLFLKSRNVKKFEKKMSKDALYLHVP